MSGVEQAGKKGGPREKRKAYVVLPVYNEEARIGNLLHRLDEAMEDADIPFQVVLVDDGSRDATGQIVQAHVSQMPILLIRHEVNRGLGATIRDGLVAAADAAGDRDIIITMDSDDTHAPGLILRMVRMISEGHDVVIASRYREGSRAVGVPLLRRVMSTGASWLFRTVFPIHGVRDYTCGYRAYRAQVLKDAIARYGDQFFDQDGFQCMVDILLKLSRMHLIFGEVPFILRYDYKEGSSKMNVGKTVRDTLGLMWKRRLGG
ncbi:MAG: glycosyltransferase family 2 protein [Candidatus Eisenbacteria bacterium]|uniref:Glycosyltransferase family 2 protein n=1 Tax=Eiseniibacteriota bacterium TaxID=2212470 RepID=A0A538S7E4_UNCEI|nr:MAG: glycosyltransferase family 2 protein [Candidatus Eisenbacteria bacterium]TMQ57405.1 MAG: glycosyltransferase family 2 protein [Candidatus Eisenbacteria bacterium]